MIRINRALEVEHGIKVNDLGSEGPFYTGGPLSPVGLDLPVDTFYVQNRGAGGVVVWIKHGAAPSDWSKQSPMDFYISASAVPETSTTSTTTFLNKVTINTPNLPLGDYRFAWRYKWRAAGANRAIDIRVQRNATTIFTTQPFTASATGVFDSTSFIPIQNISGVQTLTFDFKVFGSATTVYVADGYFEFWRTA